MINRTMQNRHATLRRNDAVTASVPGLATQRSCLAHPRLVNIHWISFDIEQFVVSSLIHNRYQDLLQGVLTTGTAEEPFY